MPKEAEFKSVQFPPLMSLARRTFWSFPPLSQKKKKRKTLSSLRYSLNHNAHGGAELARKGEGMYLSFCQCTSAYVFLRSRRRPKNLVHFLHFRKHFHNFKYNNFPFGKTPRIIHVYLAFIYLFSYPERKGL